MNFRPRGILLYSDAFANEILLSKSGIVNSLKEFDVEVNLLDINNKIREDFYPTSPAYPEFTWLKIFDNFDFIILVSSPELLNFDFYAGMAVGSKKPILFITPMNYGLNSIRYSQYHSIYTRYLTINLNRTEFLKKLTENVRKLIFDLSFSGKYKSNEHNRILSIIVESKEHSFEQELSFTLDVIIFLKTLVDNPKIELIESSKGSFKNILSIDFKSWAVLIEKIFFIIPELKKKKIDRLLIEAEIEKTKAITHQLESETNIKETEAFITLVEKIHKIGFKIQFDEDLIITQDHKGQLVFKKPPLLKSE